METSCSSINITSTPDQDPLKLANGKVSLLTFAVSDLEQSYELWCLGKKWPWIYQGDQKRGVSFLALDYFAKHIESQDQCVLQSADRKTMRSIQKVQYAEFPYAEETLDVVPRKIFPNKKDLVRIAREQAEMASVYASSHSEFYFQQSFIAPLDSILTSIYGNRRVFNKTKKSQHLGNDFRAAVGTAIPASNRGRIAHVGNLFYSGKQVVIDHGGNIFSIYAHLSKIHVKIGQVVERGEVIGLSGMTGRVSGPHLHWGVKVGTHLVDGLSLVDVSKLALNDIQISSKVEPLALQ